ncbi:MULTISPECIES: DNA-processing protein DprA [unclassified Streptomyces]|uniref:DNA-processing protein DprA n=1 Tax=unclassified Streptomyces TaxID=2593676 RepID=UPI002E2B41DE|nr:MULTISPECIES: DNA-processing protein DprA [unclassified Streptomyces]
MTTAPVRISERAARAALAHFSRPECVAAELSQLGPVGLWEKLTAADPTGRLSGYAPEKELTTAELAADFVIPGDPAWPTALDGLGDARPLGVWTRGRGDLTALSAHAIAVTGRRAPSPSGVRAAQDTARALTQAGHTVASALSYGIDTAAQHGAGAPTLAVMPCGLDACHPYNQAELLDHVTANGGLAVSVYRPGTPTSRVTLSTTATLLAALSQALVLIEPSDDVATVPLEAAEAARSLHRPVHVLTTTDPSTNIPYTSKTGRLLTSIRAHRTTQLADIVAAVD